jgi:hypothetical protein
MKRKRNNKEMETDRRNEILRNLEESETRARDKDWNKKEDEEKGEYENEFHEEVYDSSQK